MCVWRVCERARVCVYVHACVNIPPLFTAAANAVYVGHLFPRLLSLKSIVFFLFISGAAQIRHRGTGQTWKRSPMKTTTCTANPDPPISYFLGQSSVETHFLAI